MNREILRLAVPNIISNITVPLLSTVDTALMGRLSESHIGAVGIGAMVFNFIYWNFGFLRMGTTGFTAQAFGRESKEDMIHTLGRASLLVLVIAFLLIVLQYPIGELSFILMDVNPAQKDLVAQYFYIRIWAAPAALASWALMGWFFGMQNAILPLIMTVVVSVVNIVLSLLFVVVLKMDVAGVAYGTVIAQYVGLFLGLFLFFRNYKHLLKHFSREAVLKWEALKQFLRINSDIFIRTLCLTFVFAFFYSRSSTSGETLLAVNAILLQFVNWMSFGVDGFAFAAESLVGKYVGAENKERTFRAVKLSFIWGLGLGALYSLFYWLGGLYLIETVFTNEETANVVSATAPFMIWIILFPILATPCYIWDGIFIGLTASKAMRNAMLLALSVYVAAYFVFEPLYGNHGLWIAMLVFMVARALFQHILFARKGLELT